MPPMASKSWTPSDLHPKSKGIQKLDTLRPAPEAQTDDLAKHEGITTCPPNPRAVARP